MPLTLGTVLNNVWHILSTCIMLLLPVSSSSYQSTREDGHWTSDYTSNYAKSHEISERYTNK